MSWTISRTMFVMLAVSLVLLSLSISLGSPEEDASAERQRIADLESEIRHLHAKIALLQAELKAERAATSGVTQPVAASPPLADEAAECAEMDDQAADDATAPADASTPDRTASSPPLSLYRSPSQILAGLPPQFRPPLRGEWPRERKNQAADWLANEPIGHPVHLTLTVKSVEIRQNKGRQPNDNQPEWNLVFRFTPSDFEYASRKCTFDVMTSLSSRYVSYSSDHEFSIPVDTATATRAQNFKPGSTVQLLGRVQNISFDVKPALVFPASQRQPSDERYALRLAVAAWAIRCPELGLK